jgi:hypothetical protein
MDSPGNYSGAPEDRPEQPQREIKQRDFATFNTEGKLVGDPWVERYLEFLDREIRVAAGGPIARHCFHCACAAHAEFIASGNRESRYRSWLAIRTCCQWLSQLRKSV